MNAKSRFTIFNGILGPWMIRDGSDDDSALPRAPGALMTLSKGGSFSARSEPKSKHVDRVARDSKLPVETKELLHRDTRSIHFQKGIGDQLFAAGWIRTRRPLGTTRSS